MRCDRAARLLADIGMIAALLLPASLSSAADVGIETTSLSMRDDAAEPIDPDKRRLRLRSSTRDWLDPNRIFIPARGGNDDPTLIGATLVVESTGGSGERVVLQLPKAGWSAIGSSSDPKGYQYRNSTGAVQKVTLKRDTLRISAGGSGYGFTLDEATQGSVGMRLEMGSVAWCSDVSAREGGDPLSTVGFDEPGRFAGASRSAPPAICPVTATAYTLTVTNGYGSGRYAPGTVVHVWAAVAPEDQVLTNWSGDDELLDYPLEWHATLTMPARDAAVAAEIVAQSFNFTNGTFFGITARAKTFHHYIPPAPRGVVLMLHGSSGGAFFIRRTEPRSIAQRLVLSGYGVIGPEAEEAVAGDLNSDGEERWDTGLDAANVDFANLNDLIADLRSAGTIPSGTPLFVTGFSNGSTMSVSLGTVMHTTLAVDFPELVFGAALGYCAPGTIAAVATTHTPSAWFMCKNDEHPDFDNTDAQLESNYLVGQGVPSFYDEHPVSPLYDERFQREGVSATLSATIASELRNVGFVDADDNFLVSGSSIENATNANPGLMPTFSSQTAPVSRRLLDQMQVMHADHQTFSDWAQRTVAWFDAFNP